MYFVYVHIVLWFWSLLWGPFAAFFLSSDWRWALFGSLWAALGPLWFALESHGVRLGLPGKWISSTQPAHKKRPRRTHLRQPRLALYPSTVAQDPQLPAPLHSRRGLGWREFRQTPSKYSWHYQYYELSTAKCLLPLTTSTARAQTANSISGGLSLWTSWRLRWRALHIASRSAFMELYRPRTYEDTLNNRQQKTQIHMLLR